MWPFLLVILSLGFSLSANGQLERNNWLFGIRQGITFNGGSPSLLRNSSMQTFLGATSISDSNGVLLFYTNGGQVYSRKHVLMKGSDLQSVLYSTDVITLPSSNTKNRYLVFSTDVRTLRRQIIDARVNGPELGEVLSSAQWYAPSMMDGITAVKNCAEGGYWLITVDQRRNGLGIWKVDANDEITQEYAFDPLPGSVGSLLWEMNSSSDGSEIIIVGTERTFLVHFNTDCGSINKVDDLTEISPYTQPGGYGACYSPNGKYLYFTYATDAFPGRGQLVQVLAKDPLNKDFHSRVDFPDYAVRGLQNGPDGKMYMITHSIENDKTAVHAIDNPNSTLSAAGVSERAIELEGDVTTSPHFPNYLNDTRVCATDVGPSLQKTNFCEGDSIELTINGGVSYDSLFLIKTDEGKVYDLKEQNPINANKLAVGNHEFLITWSNCASRGERTIPISVFAIPKVNVNDLELCFGDSTQLDALDGDSTFIEAQVSQQWKPTDQTYFSQNGEYRALVYENGCFAEDEFSISVREPLYTQLDNKSHAFCEEAQDVVVLDAGKGFNSYLWYPTSDTTEWIEVRRSGDYYVVVQDSRGCLGRGDAKVFSDCTPNVHIPNAFSPNGDGVNDVFELDGRFYEVAQVRIFDRWGECLYANENQPLYWDGTRKGEVLPVGTYYALITYSSQFGDEKVDYQGVVHLVK